jgi:hypothetical protein
MPTYQFEYRLPDGNDVLRFPEYPGGTAFHVGMPINEDDDTWYVKEIKNHNVYAAAVVVSRDGLQT